MVLWQEGERLIGHEEEEFIHLFLNPHSLLDTGKLTERKREREKERKKDRINKEACEMAWKMRG